jgi:hypothetical protein
MHDLVQRAVHQARRQVRGTQQRRHPAGRLLRNPQGQRALSQPGLDA